jgi:hypothetical protein
MLLEETVDAAHAAPRMRWESPMNRIVILAVVGTVAIAAILVAQSALIPVAVLGLAAWFAWGRPLQPIAPRRRVASMADVVDRRRGGHRHRDRDPRSRRRRAE